MKLDRRFEKFGGLVGQAMKFVRERAIEAFSSPETPKELANALEKMAAKIEKVVPLLSEEQQKSLANKINLVEGQKVHCLYEAQTVRK
jgi:hypothetical protein